MRYGGINRTSRGVPEMFNKSANVGGIHKQTGCYIAKVVDIVDDRYEGYIYVEIVGDNYTGNTTTNVEDRHKYTKCRMSAPYGGHIQAADHTRSYGMSCHPPEPGTEVLILMLENSDIGVCIGMLPDITRNAGIPTAPTGFVEGETDTPGPTFDPSALRDSGKNTRPRYRDQEFITEQGLALDTIRGLSSSSMRRESPTNVFGFNTPGGHQFVMDDGTIKGSDSCSVPDKDRQGGLSNLTRFRSGGGAQLLMHDGAEIVYLSNHRGSCWIQLNGNGNLDIYTDNDISMHTKTNFNLHVGGDFNLDADCVNIKARGTCGTTIENATGEFNVHANKDLKLTTDLNGNIKCAGNMRTTAALIDLNGPEATAATKTVQNNITTNTLVKQSITGRVPEHEPWGGHVEEQETIPMVASPNIDLSCIDISPKSIKNKSTQRSTQVDSKNSSRTELENGRAFDNANTRGGKSISNPRAYSQGDVESVEALRDFNTSIGGGTAFTELTAGERAYAQDAGYLKSTTPTVNTTTTRRNGPR